jgi:hypothetical protein
MASMMAFRPAIAILILWSAFILAACNLSATTTPTADRQAIFTQAAQTLDARLTEVAEGALPTVTPLGTPAGTTIPVLTPAENPTPVDFTPETGTPCDRGNFVEDISIPDGTNFSPGEEFVKTWKIQNNGTCTWTSNYEVVFDSGDAMGGPPSMPLPHNVPPGNEVEVSVNLKAPQDPGSYRGDWKLRNPAGQVFGLGSDADSSFWVIISVGSEPEFSLTFDHVHTCGGSPTAIFKLDNNGDGVFESVEITLTNLNNNLVIFGPFASDGPFMGASNECPPGGDSAKPGTTRYIGGSLGPDPVGGQRVRADIKVCSQDFLSGDCVQESVEFTIP